MESAIYKIITNANNRRILVINQYYDLENSEEVLEDAFDIVYLNISNMSAQIEVSSSTWWRR